MNEENEDDTPKGPRLWTSAEDECLRASFTKHEGKNWEMIASGVPGRTRLQCCQRWTKVLCPGLKKGLWNVEEDEFLRSEVNLFLAADEKVNWVKVSKKMNGRTSKQCRERWDYAVKPGISRDEWTTKDDQLLLELYTQLGSRWALITNSFPGRTEIAVKTRWRLLNRGKEREGWTAEEDSYIVESMKDGLKPREMVQHMENRGAQSIQKRCKYLQQQQQQQPVVEEE